MSRGRPANSSYRLCPIKATECPQLEPLRQMSRSPGIIDWAAVFDAAPLNSAQAKAAPKKCVQEVDLHRGRPHLRST